MKDPEKNPEQVQRHTISLPPKLSDWVETHRGDVSFSRFIRRAVEGYRSSIAETSRIRDQASAEGQRDLQKAAKAVKYSNRKAKGS